MTLEQTRHRSTTIASTLATALVTTLAFAAAPVRAQEPPPNAGATFAFTGNRVTLTYEGRAILVGTLEGADSSTRFQSLVDSTGGRVTQVLKWTTYGLTRLSLRTRVMAGDESFPAESDPREDGLAVVRHSVGLSHSRRNRAVYDRTRDWVLSVDFPAAVRVLPVDSGAAGITYTVEATGREIGLRFRPRFYQRHRGLAYFEPWRYRMRRDVPIGWTSWFAFFDKVTEDDIRRTASMMATRLAPWGYKVLQLDDGYQRLPIGVPEHWLTPNDKFPSGMDALARMIATQGLIPAIWTNVSFADAPWALAHPQYFLRDSTGVPVRGSWVGYPMDGSNETTFRDLMAPVYRGFRAMGYEYFKLDALRHLRYEGYNSNAGAFARPGANRTAIFRDLVAQVRATIGSGAFLLACWGARPELVGLVDAVRIGDDGFGFGGLAQYNSFNNVVWRNDPDHIELSHPDAWAAITATTLTGSHLMLTDKPEFYATPRSELARKAAPVPFTLPGQLYDVDPTRSTRLVDVETELSGAGPRPFDADQARVTDLYLLDVTRPFERWTVLGRTGGGARRVAFSELGLSDSTDYLVFEAWSQEFRGVQRGALSLGAVPVSRGAEALCLRERQPRPQIIATSRHLSCGATDIADLSWEGEALTGTSDVVGGDPYDLVIHEPVGARWLDATADGARVVGVRRLGRVRTVRLVSEQSGRVRWRVRYGETSGARASA